MKYLLRLCRTLQELIAPRKILFFDKVWANRGSKNQLLHALHTVTNIHIELLEGRKSLADFTVAQKMSWASHRRTTRKEDMAYSMLGLFDLNMPLLYGEGEKAFRRLQEEIIRTSTDLTIFAWTMTLPPSMVRDQESRPGPFLSGVLASSVDDFEDCGDYQSGIDGLREFSTSNLGIRIRVRIQIFSPESTNTRFYVLPVASRGVAYLGIRVRQIGHEQYLREDPFTLYNYTNGILIRVIPAVERFLLVKIPDKEYYSAGPRMQIASMSSVLSRGRAYVLQFEMDRDMRIADPWPLHRFDHPDSAFIAPENARRDFGTIVLEARINIPGRNHPIPVACHFYAFGWYFGRLERAQLGFVEGSVHGDALASSLQTWVETWDRSTPEFIAELQRRKIPKKPGVVFKFPGTSYVALMTFEVDAQDKDGVCTHVYWKVKFAMEVFPNIQSCPEVWEEGWEFPYDSLGHPL